MVRMASGSTWSQTVPQKPKWDKVKCKATSVLVNNNAYGVYNTDIESSECIFLLKVSALLLLFLAQPPVHGKNWVFLKE